MYTEHPLPPPRQIRALFDPSTVTVYQAFSQRIADAALSAGTFVSPFSMARMTWIKPSFLWMMYRSGWATKPGQERILAVSMSRAGFEAALKDSCLSQFDPQLHRTHEAWRATLASSLVRVQWDPERDLDLKALPWRTIQIGLSGAAVERYVSEWIVAMSDATDTVHRVRALILAGRSVMARDQLPAEISYPLPSRIAEVVNASTKEGIR